MPFTLSHPAIVIPFMNSRFRLSVTALVAGSMVPDFEFFFQMREVENIGHHWYGILLFDIPVAALFCYLFHNLLRNAFVVNLPAFYRNRFIHALDFNWNKYVAENRLRFLFSLLIGIASHLFLDAFTHHDGTFVLMFPFLLSKIDLMNLSIPVYFLLQVISSVMGIWMLQRLIDQMPEQTERKISIEKNRFYWPSIFLTFFIIISLRLLIWPEFNSFWGIFMAVMGGIVYAWLLVSVIVNNNSNFLKKN